MAHGLTSAEIARRYGLRLSEKTDLLLRRRRCGRGFTWFGANGEVVRDPAMRERLNALAIPPAYRDVRAAAEPEAHLQATGVDDRGRTQYLYHPLWREVREEIKARRLRRALESLPRLRAQVQRDLSAPDLTNTRVVAGIVALMDQTAIRLGSPRYRRLYGSVGALTLEHEHVVMENDCCGLRFTGKAGKAIETSFDDPALCRLMRDLLDTGDHLIFTLASEEGRRPAIAHDVQSYLAAHANGDISPKTLRAIRSSSLAVAELKKSELPPTKVARARQKNRVFDEVAEALGNTRAVVKESYVPAIVVNAFEDGKLNSLMTETKPARRLKRSEAALKKLLRRIPRGGSSSTR